MKMYPENQTLRMNGEDVVWPGVDPETGKFTNGDLNDPETPPSFIPAETLNLLLDNMAGAIEELGGTPNNKDGDQFRAAISNFITKRTPALSHAFGKERFLVFDFTDTNRRSLKIKAGTQIRLDITETGGSKSRRWFAADDDLTLNLDAQIRAAALATATRTGEENGRNFYVYLVPDGESGTKFVVSCNSTFPNDISDEYTANNTRKIGQFHTLCANAGSDLYGEIAEAPSCGLVAGDTVLVKQYGSNDEDGFHDFYTKTVLSVTAGAYYDVVKVRHPLAGFRAGEILPESVFCLSFRPKSSPDGMCYDIDTDLAVDIYIQSGKGSATASEYNAPVTNSRAHPNHQDDLRHVGKRLLHDHEFSSMALGSNESTAISGAANPGKVGGHTDSAGRRMVSFIGIEDACGVWWQWLEDVAALGYGAAYGNTNEVGSNGFTGGYVGGHVSNLYSANSTTAPYGGESGGHLSDSGWNALDGQEAFGSMYCVSCALLAGGDWCPSSFCGSRSRAASCARSRVTTDYAGRGASRLLRRA